MFEVSSYGIYELQQTIHDDAHAVRDEAAKRSEVLGKKIAAARARVAKLLDEAAKIEAVYSLAIEQISKGA